MRHRAYIYDRGALTLVGELNNVEHVHWQRMRDETTVATVRFNGNCSTFLEKRHVGRYELVVTRDGRRVWEGPLTYFQDKGVSKTLKARDVSWYTNRTALTVRWNNGEPNVGFAVDRLEAILLYEMQIWEDLDPPINLIPNLNIIKNPNGARTARITEAYQSYVYEELDSLAWRGGIDYHVTGRTLTICDTDEDLGTIRTITEEDIIGNFAITSYGVELAAISVVTDGEGRAGIAGAADPYYGPVTLLHTEFNEGSETADVATDAELRSQAQRNLLGRNPTPVVLRMPEGSVLNPCVVDELFPYLFPGVKIPVRITDPEMETLRDTLRLDKLDVNEDADGEVVTISASSAPGEIEIGEEE